MTVTHRLWSISKGLGVFDLCRVAGPRGQRILCYHGFSSDDEHRYRPSLFITPQTFESRLAWLRRKGFRGISLQEALRRLRDRRTERNDVVITIDDGFASVASIGWPLLKEFGFGATLYVTTYYVVNPNPVFRLAIEYMFWKTRSHAVRLADLGPGVPDFGTVGPHAPESHPDIIRLVEWAETHVGESERVALARRLGALLDVDYDELVVSRRLSLLRPAEISELAAAGLDVQLHTHRHRLPAEGDGIRREIEDNRCVLEPLLDRRLTQFCYPSGAFSPRQFASLRDLGIESATTCLPGFNYTSTPALALRRFLDSEIVSDIAFAAELSGLKESLRSVLVKGRRHGDEHSPEEW